MKIGDHVPCPKCGKDAEIMRRGLARSSAGFEGRQRGAVWIARCPDGHESDVPDGDA
jgi:hypothetical protein